MSGPRPVQLLRREGSIVHQHVRPGTARRVLAFTRPYRGTLIGFLAVVLLDAGVISTVPLLFRAIIDRGIAGHRPGLVVALALAVAGLAVLDAALTLTQRVVTARVGEQVVCDLRTRMFDHLLRMPIAFFTRTQTGSVVSRLNADVLGAQSALTDLMSNVVGSAVLAIVVLVVMATLSLPITLFALVVLPIIAIPVRLIGRRLGQLTRTKYDLSAAMVSSMTERFNVSGALLVQLFGDPQRESEQFARRARSIRDVGIRIALAGRVFFVGLTLAAALTTAIVYGWGGVRSANGELGVGTLVALSVYLGRLYGPLSSLAGANADVMTALVAFDRVFEVLDVQPAITERPDARALPAGPCGVSFESVIFGYPIGATLVSLEGPGQTADRGGEPALRGIDFEVPAGQLAALVGRSGAGKTTIGTLAARLYDPSSGTVRVGGQDVRELTLASLRARVGVVTQDPHLFHDTVRANLLYACPDADETQLWVALEQAAVADVVRLLPDGLDTVVGDRGHRLSGGEKQRVAIARLLLRNPDVVILDEATAHLDAVSEAAVHDALARALGGRTALVIAHRLSTIRAADVVLVVDAGRIVERGTHAELLRAGGVYAQLYRTQFADQDDVRAGSP